MEINKANQAEQTPATKKGIVEEMLADGFNLDWSIPRTFFTLLHRPSTVAAAYQTDEQRRYASPFKYILITAALCTFLGTLVVDMDEVMRGAMDVGLRGESAAIMAEHPELQRFMEQVQVVGVSMTTKYLGLTYLLLFAPITALLTSLFFREEAAFTGAFKRHFGLNVYAWAEGMLLPLPFLVTIPLLDSLAVYAALGMILTIGYVLWAQMKMFKLTGFKGFAKALGAFLIAYVLYAIASAVVMYSIAAALFFLG